MSKRSCLLDRVLGTSQCTVHRSLYTPALAHRARRKQSSNIRRAVQPVRCFPANSHFALARCTLYGMHANRPVRREVVEVNYDTLYPQLFDIQPAKRCKTSADTLHVYIPWSGMLSARGDGRALRRVGAVGTGRRRAPGHRAARPAPWTHSTRTVANRKSAGHALRLAPCTLEPRSELKREGHSVCVGDTLF